MDITNFFWQFIDYHLGIYKNPTNLDLQMFNIIYQGDVIMNIKILDSDEPNEYQGFDTFSGLLCTAMRICTGEKLQKMEKFLKYIYDEHELMESFERL